jgi:hypothetical protein
LPARWTRRLYISPFGDASVAEDVGAVFKARTTFQ